MAELTWRTVFRIACNLLSGDTLDALRHELRTGGRHLCRGNVTRPTLCFGFEHQRVEQACLLGWMASTEDGAETVEAVHTAFADLCWHIADGLPNPYDSGSVVSYWDDTSEAESIPALLAELDAILAERAE